MITNEGRLMRQVRDADPRVRTRAIQTLLGNCEAGDFLSLNHYRTITELCDNSEKNVRLMALKIVQIYAETHPDKMVKTVRGFNVRLQDDAFAVVCHAINDLEASVRTEAARLLGCFNSVSNSFLHQTLDKKLMRQMRMLGDGTQAKNSSGANKWSTGKKLGEDVPMEKDDEESQSMIPTGACGAFVTALEDELMAVRQAAVYSLGKLAVNRQEFANLCIDHLADMFNDEIQEVRLDAIRALAPLVIHGTLQQEQLYTILTVLDDASSENRMAIHELIAKSNLADADCIRQCIRVLLHSLKRFPFDKYSIYKCLSSVGLGHSLLVHGLVTELLEIHPVFDTPEQHIDDDFYLGKLIVVLNAASKNPVICSIIPNYVKKHYRYLRCASANLIPIVKEFEENKIMSGNSKFFDFSMLAGYKLDSLLEITYERIREVYYKEEQIKSTLLDLLISDLKAFQNLEQEIAVPAGFLYSFCTLLKLYDLTLRLALNAENLIDFNMAVCESTHKIFGIENQYKGLSPLMKAFLTECSFRLMLLLALQRTDIPFVQLCETLTDLIQKFQLKIDELQIQPAKSTTELIKWMQTSITQPEDFKKPQIKVEAMEVDGNENSPPILPPRLSNENLGPTRFEFSQNVEFRKRIYKQLMKWPICLPKTMENLNGISIKCIKVVDPNKDVQNEFIVRFVSGLPTGILINCLLSNLTDEDLERFRVQIEYPDQSTTFYRPKKSEYHRLDEAMVRLQAQVIVSARNWAEPAFVQFTCGLLSCVNKGDSNFVPLPDADNSSQLNRISIRIHPMARA